MHAQSEVAARKAAATVAAVSLSRKGVPLTGLARRTANLLTAVLSLHPAQAIRNAAYYAMQHLLGSFKVRLMSSLAA